MPECNANPHTSHGMQIWLDQGAAVVKSTTTRTPLVTPHSEVGRRLCKAPCDRRAARAVYESAALIGRAVRRRVMYNVSPRAWTMFLW